MKYRQVTERVIHQEHKQKSKAPIETLKTGTAVKAPVLPASFAINGAVGTQLTPEQAVQLQRTAGNRAVLQALGNRTGQPRAIQPKLTVGAADDPYEREADRVAGQVLAPSAGPTEVQREEQGEGNTTRRKPAERSERITPLAQAQRAPAAQDLGGSFEAGASVERALASGRGAGSPLPARLRADLEPRFGADFASVRVHTGGESDHLNRQLGAKAFTHGNDIYLSSGQYDPGSGAGQRLLAHELTHVMQQGGSVKRRVQRYPATAIKSSSKLDWVKQTLSVDHPSEGKSGGVFIFGSDAPLTSIVVKPEYYVDQGNDPETAKVRINARAKSSIGTDILKVTGVSTPDTRIVSDSEKNAILAAASQHSAAIPNVHNDAVTGEPSQLDFIRIMGKAQGESIAKASSEKEKNTGNVDVIRLVNRLSNIKLMKEVGKMIAIDAFVKMGDRVTDVGANLGNIMFAGDTATAIDNSSDLRKLNLISKAGVGLHFAQLLLVLNDRPKLIDSFLGSVESLIGDPTAQQAFHGYIASNDDVVQKWKNALSTGMDDGIASIKALFASKKSRATMKKSVTGWGKAGSSMASWEAMKETYKVFEIVGGGEQDMAQVARLLKEYRAYREARAKRMFGFKWMTSKTKKRVQ